MCDESRASFSESRRKKPFSKIVSPPRRTTHGDDSSNRSALPRAPRIWPTLPTMRPTLGSSPATAHFSSGPLTSARPSDRAAASLSSPRTATRSTWFVPSPFRTTWCASCARTSPSAASNASLETPSTAPLDARTHMSDVDSSPSTPTLPNVPGTTRSSALCNAARGKFASVRTKHSIVPMLGSIIPAPLTSPTKLAPFGSSARAALA
mmetsp:Transcript_18215/g.55522  ORF Transcript_18215/g.55522 Transcript_18215/m.55522 type:complete len:208 (-) Transcript_18215:728-1351(-)